MATATKKSAEAPSASRENASWLAGAAAAVESVYRFLASLKLAVLSLGTLAAVLSYATFFEKWYGTAAVQEWIYQSKGFAVLLAFLGANILCAALIRYPWKKRQTGFVITHVGLLVVLGGSWYSVMTSDEGQVAALEGEVKGEIVRNDYPVVRIRQIDPHDPAATLHEWELPFRPGAFGWGPGQPRPKSVIASVLSPFVGGDDRNPRDVLTKPRDPFRFVVKSHIPASVPTDEHVADPDGVPMAKIRPLAKPPGKSEASDVFRDEHDRWFSTDKRLYKVVKSHDSAGEFMPAQFAFQYVDRPELVEEFLNPPAESGNEGVARFRYKDKAGKPRTYDWALDGQSGKSKTLPDSALSVKFLDVVGFPAAEAGLAETLGESTVPIAEFEVSDGGKPAVKHFGLANLPMFPNVIPGQGRADAPPPKALVELRYYLPPVLDPKRNGRFGLVEVLGTPDGKLFYRVFGRGEGKTPRSQVRAKGPVTKGKEIVAFSGNANMPMTLAFQVDDYLTAGVEKLIYEPVVLPPGQMGNGIAASLVEMTVPDPDAPSKEITREFYISRSATLDPEWQTVAFGNNVYKIAYDVDRSPLGFELKMIDFQRGFDPGTEQASRFSSDVLLTDKSMGITSKPYHIAMNEPLTHRGYTFYQSSFVREKDTQRRETGRVQSVFQVGLNPGRRIMYGGCLLVVLGAFVQFYMRAGLFTDGGKREREMAARKTPGGGPPAGPDAAPPRPDRADDEDVL